MVRFHHCQAIIENASCMQEPRTGRNIKKAEVRSIKAQEQIRINQFSTSRVPETRLRGTWLEKPGFAPEQMVIVTTMKKHLIIRVEE